MMAGSNDTVDMCIYTWWSGDLSHCCQCIDFLERLGQKNKMSVCDSFQGAAACFGNFALTAKS